MTPALPDVETRARKSLGSSANAIYRAVADAVSERHSGGGILIDVGCGAGNLWSFLGSRFDRYVGVDVVRYDGLPEEVEFHRIDLDTGQAPLPDAAGDVVVAVETIEHLENPRAFVRELTRLTRPGGLVVVTTPNQLSLLSKMTLLLKNEFNAFRAGNYPAHLTALLEIDLRRIGAECAWGDIAVTYSVKGRAPGTSRSWPRFLSHLFPRAFSDNIVLIGRKRGSDGRVDSQREGTRDVDARGL
jgi:SAM-dependent methyltransferase